jgi:glycosyltransferase involved in cell wall biosynthesis
LDVVHLITDLDVGGAELTLLRLVSASPPSLRHHVVSLRGGGALEEKFRSASVDVSCFDTRTLSGMAAAVVKLAMLLHRKRPTVVMSWLYHADLVATLATRLAPPTRLIWNIRCADMDLRRYSRLTRTLPHILAPLSGFPERVLANSEAGRRAHAAYGYRPRRWEVLRNGVDATRFRPDPEARARARKEFGTGDDHLLVGLVARVDPMKGHADFLAAAAGLAPRHPSARFVLIGRQTEDEQITQLAEEMGLAPRLLVRTGERSDLEHLLPGLDVAVSASLSEGFPNVVAEAMACGVPCVVTDVGDSAVIVGDSGRVVPKASPLALAQAISDILALDEGGRRMLGNAARARVESEFSEDECWRRYADVLRQA